MICAGEDSGIYYWDDAYNFGTSNDDSNVYWIADSFTEFWNSIGQLFGIDTTSEDTID